MMEMPELKDCPFCGCRDAKGTVKIKCPQCGASSGHEQSEVDAARKWNTRADLMDREKLVAVRAFIECLPCALTANDEAETVIAILNTMIGDKP